MSIKQRVGVHSLTGKIFLLEVQYGIAYYSSHRNPGGMKVMYHTLLFVAAAITGPLLVSSISRSIIGSEHSECSQYTAPRSRVNRSIIWSTWYMYKVPGTKYHFTLLNLHYYYSNSMYTVHLPEHNILYDTYLVKVLQVNISIQVNTLHKVSKITSYND